MNNRTTENNRMNITTTGILHHGNEHNAENKGRTKFQEIALQNNSASQESAPEKRSSRKQVLITQAEHAEWYQVRNQNRLCRESRCTTATELQNGR
jgi:hypothetical protein